MAAIDVYLQQILAAIYGEEVRGSIHDAIQAMNVESTTAEAAAISAQNSATQSAQTATTAKNDAVSAKNDAVAAKVAAEAAAQEAAQAASGAMKYKGAVTFANLPTTNVSIGDMYNITDAFTADSKFQPTDVGKKCKPGTNVAYDNNGKWDIVGYMGGPPLPDGGAAGQFVVKNSATEGDANWYSGIYFFTTVAAMNAAISGGLVADKGLCIVDEGSGSTPALYLQDILDVNLLSLSDSQALCYDMATGFWVNKDVLGIIPNDQWTQIQSILS